MREQHVYTSVCHSGEHDGCTAGRIASEVNVLVHVNEAKHWLDAAILSSDSRILKWTLHVCKDLKVDDGAVLTDWLTRASHAHLLLFCFCAFDPAAEAVW